MLSRTQPQKGLGLREGVWSTFQNCAAPQLEAGELAVLDLGMRSERLVGDRARFRSGVAGTPWDTVAKAETGDERHGVWLVARKAIKLDRYGEMDLFTARAMLHFDREVPKGALIFAPSSGVLALLSDEVGDGHQCLGYTARAGKGLVPCIFNGWDNIGLWGYSGPTTPKPLLVRASIETAGVEAQASTI